MKSPRNILTEKKKELMTKPQGQQQSRLKKSHTGGSLQEGEDLLDSEQPLGQQPTSLFFLFVCLDVLGLGWVGLSYLPFIQMNKFRFFFTSVSS